MEILRTSSILSHRIGEYFEFQPYCDGATNWAADGLPEGVEINAATGRISGQCQAKQVTNFRVTAQNTATGEEAEAMFVLGIKDEVAHGNLATPLEPDVLRVTVDLDTGNATSEQAEAADGKGDAKKTPVAFSLKGGDRRQLAVRFMRGGLPQVMRFETLKFGLKEFTDEQVVVSSDQFVQRGEWFLIDVDLTTQEVAGAINDYVEDYEAGFDALGEFEWTRKEYFKGTEEVVFRASTNTFRVHVAKDLIPNEDE